MELEIIAAANKVPIDTTSTITTSDEIYEEFWKGIVEMDGEIDFAQLKKELADYYVVLWEGEVDDIY